MSKAQQTVLVTGAEGSLGSAVVERFLDAGCTVVATYLQEKAPGWKSSDRLIPLQMDVTDASSVRKALSTMTASRPIDSLVHCAGGFRFTNVESFSDGDLDFLIRLNFKSAFVLARELVPGMKSRGFGRIVFIGAKATLHPTAGMGLYAASKAALNVLTQSLAEEVKGSGINVNAVLPSIIDTPANRKDMPGADFTSWVKREALAEIVFSLTQPWGDAIQGALIPVAGRV